MIPLNIHLLTARFLHCLEVFEDGLGAESHSFASLADCGEVASFVIAFIVYLLRPFGFRCCNLWWRGNGVFSLERFGVLLEKV